MIWQSTDIVLLDLPYMEPDKNRHKQTLPHHTHTHTSHTLTHQSHTPVTHTHESHTHTHLVEGDEWAFIGVLVQHCPCPVNQLVRDWSGGKECGFPRLVHGQPSLLDHRRTSVQRRHANPNLVGGARMESRLQRNGMVTDSVSVLPKKMLSQTSNVNVR